MSGSATYSGNLPTPATGGDAQGDGIHEGRRRFSYRGLAWDGAPFQTNAWAARVVQEKSPSRAGVVRAMARSDHWRCVSTPRWVRTSWKVTSSCQAYKPFQDLDRVRRWSVKSRA